MHHAIHNKRIGLHSSHGYIRCLYPPLSLEIVNESAKQLASRRRKQWFSYAPGLAVPAHSRKDYVTAAQQKDRAKIVQLGASQRWFNIATAAAKSKTATLSVEALHTNKTCTAEQRGSIREFTVWVCIDHKYANKCFINPAYKHTRMASHYDH